MTDFSLFAICKQTSFKASKLWGDQKLRASAPALYQTVDEEIFFLFRLVFVGPDKSFLPRSVNVYCTWIMDMFHVNALMKLSICRVISCTLCFRRSLILLLHFDLRVLCSFVGSMFSLTPVWNLISPPGRANIDSTCHWFTRVEKFVCTKPSVRCDRGLLLFLKMWNLALVAESAARRALWRQSAPWTYTGPICALIKTGLSTVGPNRAQIVHQTSPLIKAFGAAGGRTTTTTECFLFRWESRC